MPTLTYKLRSSLLAALLFSPLLASADSFSEGGYAVLVFALVVVAAVPLLLIILALLAYWFSGSKAWQTANAVGLVISLVAGALWAELARQPSSLAVFFHFNPFWQLSAPVAAWLGGMVQARADVRPWWRLGWVALAVVGARQLLGAFQQLGFIVLAAHQQGTTQLALQAVMLQVLNLVLSFGVWLLVLWQVQRQHPLHWHDADQLAAPAVVAAAGLGLALAGFLRTPSLRDSMFTPAILGTFLLWAVLGFGIGALAIWLDQRRRYAPAKA